SPSISGLPPLLARISLDAAAVPAEGLRTLLADLDRRLTAYGAQRVPIVLSLGVFPERDDRVDSWQQVLRTITESASGRVAAYQIGTVASAAAPPNAERYAFLLKLASVQLRTRDASTVVIEGPVPESLDEWQGRVYAAGTAPYVDGLAIGHPEPAG